MAVQLRLGFILLLILLSVLSGCGGGGAVAEGGIGGSGISWGKMSNPTATSLTVNGVTFNTTNARYTKDGASAAAADLQQGMVIMVTGTLDSNGTTGTATSVSYNDLLEGPVTAIAGNSLTVMQQTVIVDGATLFSGGLTAVTDINDNDVLEVSGFYTADNKVYATYVERTNAADHEIKGLVTPVDDSSFMIGALTINWASAGSLQSGDFVKAEGAYNTVSNEFTATSVEIMNRGFEIEDADDAEIEALATTACGSGTVPRSFNMSGVTINVDADTQIHGGLLANIQPGIYLEVEGYLNNGVMTAREIEFKDGIELESDVVSVDTVANTLTLEFGTVDVTVTIEPDLTEFDGFTRLSDITDADHVEVRGRMVGSTILASRIVNRDGATDVELQAAVEAESNPSLTVLGVTINTTGMEFEDSNETPMTQDAFFASIQVGDLVKVSGVFDLGTIIWQRVEIE